ncbi:MAG: MBL fold metallo-hydrolase [Candidatus Omnitrophota bacterium]
MYVKVLFDKEAKRGLQGGHGFSCLIDNKILFDTGGGSLSLVENMDRMMVSALDLEAVVISHDHWDHTGGLWEVLKRKPGLKVYACSSSSDTFKRCVKELGGELVFATGKPAEVAKNIFVTGEMKGTYKDDIIDEQALVVKGDKGVSIITGCAHPGIVDIVKFIKKEFCLDKLYMVFGGFHLEGKEREDIQGIMSDLGVMGVQKIGPTHCSGEKARRIFSGVYQDNYIVVKAGHIIGL